jgi:hypothetical protein
MAKTYESQLVKVNFYRTKVVQSSMVLLQLITDIVYGMSDDLETFEKLIELQSILEKQPTDQQVMEAK